MLGAGTVINPIIKVVTTVVVLGAVYLFIVKPVLDTTDKVVTEVGQGIDDARADTEAAFREAELNSARSRAQSFAQSLQSTWPAASREVRACVKQAGDDIPAMKQCDNMGQRLVHTVQSDRSFALSYANSLAAADAAQVRECVKRAGFETAAMQRCRNLADDLLFG